MAGLYIHVPYCTAKCAYCDFYSGPFRLFEAESYFAAVKREFDARRNEIGSISTVYFGGGTPGAVNPRYFAPYFSLCSGEKTVEVNPENITLEYVQQLMDCGANRVSMGVQSLVDAELSAIGRRHSADDARQAFATLRSTGFCNLSLDLIYGLPGQTLESWRYSLRELIALKPEHISAYLLSYEEGTSLTARRNKGIIQEADEELAVKMYELLCEETRRAGYRHYEISNFALPGYEAQHNSAYWDMTPYLGLGPGAHSFDGHTRRENPRNLKEYLRNPEAFAIAEEEDDENRFNDLLITSLRTARGIDPSAFTAAELLKAEKLLYYNEAGRLRISEAAWLNSNSILLELLR
ncbi:MAG: radical SAM family heme chaperone HemW [Bacteroides sp.]|nr:radical SAM family heme chaperone HemW [Bacteroides sp.]MCM1378927.1 radical SAM family heme chaperone HemW [Bacteroides sp.]MCM1445543.1 radical SAM family heme chaperone HemW [Prevotella sp.]